ncbi:MAG: hypothetical protein SynsKO_00430 [Synoicihabitans sp.]
MSSSDKKSKLRVSDWGDPAGSGENPTPAPASTSPSGTPLPTPNAPEPEGGEPAMDLPVDPWRLLGGIWQRRYRIVLGGLLGLAAGLTLGWFTTESRFQVSAQLIKREVPTSFRAGEVGEAYRPRTLSSATLIGLAGSANVLQRVSEQSNPPVSLGLLRRSAEVAEQRGTDYLYLTLSGYTSPEDTVKLANVWATEVVDYTREMQSRESREIRQYLQNELDNNEAELERISAGLLEYTAREGLVSVDKQIDAQLRAIGDLDLRYDTARLEIDSIEVKLRSLEAELARQSPLAEELKIAQQDLKDLQVRYTDTNPLVRDSRDRVTEIQERYERSQNETSDDLSRFAGTFLGNTLYLQILELRSQQEALVNNLGELQKLRDDARQELKDLPSKEIGIAQLTRTRESLENTRDLLLSRLREAELFEERAPGYYRIFAPATMDAVIIRPKLMKVIAYGGAGLVGLLGLAFVAALVFELLDNQLRTGAEAAKAWKSLLLAKLPASPPEDLSELEDDVHLLWSRWLGQSRQNRGLQILWAPKASPAEEVLWQALLTEAHRLLPDLVIIDASPDEAGSCSALDGLPRTTFETIAGTTGLSRLPVAQKNLSIQQAEQLTQTMRQLTSSGRPVWLRVQGSVREPLSTLARHGSNALVIVPLATASIPFWRQQAERFEKTVGSIGGVVALGEVPWHQR